MVVQALRPGNRVLAAGEGASRHLAPLRNRGFALAVIDRSMHPDGFDDLAPDAVAADETQDLAAVRRSLSERRGPLVRLITERFHPVSFAVERAICIDTTAAGGNAALLAASSG
jgi:RHH-type proline utilization regulon transcriptional repressor/proline dehydrogenase/delta 1-pyrroline-5-carboxylate dehydrogenase